MYNGEKFRFLENKIREIIKKINELDSKKKISIVGYSSDGDYSGKLFFLKNYFIKKIIL
jgi:hypothetical protein